MITTLRNWQTIKKNKKDLIFCSSEYRFGDDRLTGFSIGLSPKIVEYIEQKDFYTIQIGNHSKTAFCRFTIGTDDIRWNNTKNRKSITETLSRVGIINNYASFDQRGYMNISDIITYYSTMPEYKFVISPEGQSKDCHRHYEAILAGCIPVVEYSNEVKDIYNGCPILWTDDYSEINEEYLLEKYDEMIDKEFDFSKMFLYNYTSEQQKEIIQNANYWIGDGRWGEPWYD